MIPNLSEDEKTIIYDQKRLLEEDLKKQSIAVRGYDREMHSILIKLNRVLPSYETDLQSYETAQIFICEKAVAVNEVLTKGIGEKSLSIWDFSELAYANLPPWSLRISLIRILQEHYPERAAKLVILDSPYWFRTMYSVIQPFLSTATQEKVLLINGDEAKREVLEPILDCDQAMPFMLPEGQLTSPIDNERVMNQPFHFLYDDCT